MIDELDEVAAVRRDEVYSALIAVLAMARVQVDQSALITILTAATSSEIIGDRLAAMNAPRGFDAGYLEELLAGKRLDEPAFVADGLESFFAFAAGLALAAIGQSRLRFNPKFRSEHDRYVASLRSTFAADTVRAAIETVQRMASAQGSVESRVKQVVRSIGLSPLQAASLEAARGVLFTYLAGPAQTARVGRGRKRSTPQAGRPINARRLLARAASRLSPPQRAMLAKAMTPALDEAGAEQLLSRHATKLIELRASVAAGYQTHAVAEQAKLSAWRLGQRVGALPRDQRRFWQTAGDEKVRHSHAEVPAMNRAGVELDKPFATPLGDCMTPPLEINCRCKAVLRPVA